LSTVISAIHEGRAGAHGHARRGAAPHDGAAPLDGGLGGVHLGAHGRVQAIGRHQQRAGHLHALAVARFDERGHAPGILPVAGHAMAQPHGALAQALLHGIEQHHLQLSAVHRILRPPVAGLQAARFGIDLVAVAAYQGPFPRLQPDGVQHIVAEAQVMQLPHGVGLQVDAHAQRLQLRHRLEHDAGHADLVQREGGGHATDAAAGNEHGAGGIVVGSSSRHAGIVHAITAGKCPAGAACMHAGAGGPAAQAVMRQSMK
jgi:hypothetical protein